MKQRIVEKMEKLSNDAWATIMLGMVALTIALTLVDVVALALTALLLVVVAPATITYLVAQMFDALDDNIHAKVEMSWGWHLLYAFGTATVLGLLFGTVAATTIALPMWLFRLVSPRVLFLALCAVASLAGYALAWKSIPNQNDPDFKRDEVK